MKHTLLILFALLHATVYGQGSFRGVIANALDSGVIGNAMVTVVGSGGKILADVNGRFSVSGVQKGRKVVLAISAIGVSDTVTASSNGSQLHWVLVNVGTQKLDDYVLHSMSAEDVVRRAVSLIPVNHANIPYFCYSSYRQYQRLDSTYTNLVEAKPVVMMNVSATKGMLDRTEAYSNVICRRTYFTSEPNNAYEINASDLMSQDPVYHLYGGSLAPGRLFHYRFRFDTVAGSDTSYVIHYRSNDYSSERHGVSNPGNPFPGESWEEGRITIDRYSFAIRKFTRIARRHDAYNYPRNNNFILPDRLYYLEFVDAYFAAEYVQLGERWYPGRYSYRFTNDCYGSGKGFRPNVRFSCFYEWQADSFSRYTGDDYASRFYKELYLWPQKYDLSEWQVNRHGYLLTDSTVLFNDLKKRGELEVQFRTNVKPAPLQAKNPGEHVPQSDK